MTMIVFDTESDGFRDESTVVHCICLKEISTMPLEAPESLCEQFSTRPLKDTRGNIESGLQRLSEASMLIGQNIINHDLPLLKRLHDWEPNPETRIFDTMVVSRLLNPDRQKPEGYTGKGGPNSIEAWGYRLGRYKVEHEDWANLSTDMLRRCSEDVEINARLYYTLLEEIGNHDWSEAIEIEHEVARIMTQQELNGVMFDGRAANNLVHSLQLRIDELDSRLHSVIPKKLSVPYEAKPIEQPFKKNGELTHRALSWFADEPVEVGGPFTRVKFEPINISSQEQLKTYLLSIGWEPTEWNYKDGNRTSPKLTEDSFESITGDIGQSIKGRTLLSHRKSQVEGLISLVRQDGRIAARANTCGTNTGRFRHIGVVNIPKASDRIPYGKEIRSLFCVPENKVLVGHDASGLELRMLAHYMNDKKFIEELLHGDIHTANQHMAGLPTRDLAKSFIYAFLYGAGDEKIGRLVGGSAKDGKMLKQSFLSNLPSLKNLIQRSKAASKKGYLKGLDGRRVMMRSYEGDVMEHKALNTLLQSAGAIVMKKSMILLDQEVKKHNLDVLKVIDMHDEAQAEVHPGHVELYKQLAVQSIIDSGIHFKLNCPLAGEAKSGKNWAETH